MSILKKNCQKSRTGVSYLSHRAATPTVAYVCRGERRVRASRSEIRRKWKQRKFLETEIITFFFVFAVNMGNRFFLKNRKQKRILDFYKIVLVSFFEVVVVGQQVAQTETKISLHTYLNGHLFLQAANCAVSKMTIFTCYL